MGPQARCREADTDRRETVPPQISHILDREKAFSRFPSTRKIATRRSFNTLDTWHDEFLNQAGPSDPQRFPFILVGNKIDLDDGSKRMVPEKKARKWCASKGDIPYFETSAKEDHNVDTAFLCIARLALEHEHDQDIYFKTVVEQVSDTEQTSGCAC
ncbi:Ras-related protein RABG3a [Zea mays]|uniref:Ras-related protein RABG3a n=2 Tax=Zea mays TaxID=4577 RepID=A0A1D6JVN2_MAIZE|nr:Ras-related protein RABG3a [Zea mays]